MAEQRAEVESIATDQAEPTVANTLDALERSGELLTRVASLRKQLEAHRKDPTCAGASPLAC